MSRAKEFERVLDAAEVWKQRCLLGAGSLFTDQALWTRKNFDELYKLYVDNPDESEGKFLEKLKRQLDPGSPDAKCLWAEMAWVYQLTQGPESLKPATKRDRIARIWGWSGRDLPEGHELLSDRVLGAGKVRTGVGWNTDAWLGYVFFVDAMRSWFSQREYKRQQLLRDPWKFMSWLDATKYAAKRMFRHALLFLLFPDDFEPTVSTKDKVSIVDGLRRGHDFDTSNAGAIDRALREIRSGLEEEHPGFSFYSSPIRERWKGGTPNPTPAPKPGPSPKPTYTVDDAHESVFVPRSDFDRILKSIQSRKNLILQGPPGTGKTFVARRIAWQLIGRKDNNPIEMVQFHQSYAYEDFVQGYRPTDNGGFERKNGVFHRFCERARKSEAPYVFLIDEINRGNLSRIFGELLMLIEADKRSDEYAVRLTYSDHEPFHVPKNVYILGMMNTADRSLAVVDYALRRRFAFETLKPAFATDYGREQFNRHLKAKGATPGLIARISDRIGQLNKKISEDRELGVGFQIGHSYFVPDDGDEPSEDWYRHIVETQIAPLLREYWFDSPKDVEETLAELRS